MKDFVDGFNQGLSLGLTHGARIAKLLIATNPNVPVEEIHNNIIYWAEEIPNSKITPKGMIAYNMISHYIEDAERLK